MAFAQLAEEYRRAGANDDAVSVCRAGLAHHPDYLSARVTLGRALVELGRLEEAQAELAVVLHSAPDNLAANRAVAEIYQRRGQLNDALTHYKIALQLAQHDPELERAVERIQNVMSPPPPPPKAEAAPIAVEDLFDFDALLAQLGAPVGRQPEAAASLEPIAHPTEPEPIHAEPSEIRHDDGDPLAVLEQRLRESEERSYLDRQATLIRRRNERMIARLESWLEAILVDRHAA